MRNSLTEYVICFARQVSGTYFSKRCLVIYFFIFLLWLKLLRSSWSSSGSSESSHRIQSVASYIYCSSSPSSCSSSASSIAVNKSLNHLSHPHLHSMGKHTLRVWCLVVLALIFVSCTSGSRSISQTSTTPPPTTPITPAKTSTELGFPIDRALERVTKKTFWLKVSPGHSPVSPEKFSGYHTGVDFETTEDEKDREVTIRAICTWPLLMKKWATGYGGVAVQKCQIDAQDVTIIYGHLKFESITTAINTPLSAGDKLGILGLGYSHKTDGERKHLHLAIHKWTTVNILWYVQNSSELNQWIDPMKYFENE